MDHITDDQLWERRHVPIPEQARWFGVPEWEFRAELRNRGWIRATGGALETAPCAECPGLVEITPMTTERLCASCLAGETPIPPLTDELIADPAALLRRERMRVRRKRARLGERAWADRYARPGGPEMRRVA